MTKPRFELNRRTILVPLYFFLGGIAGGSFVIAALATMSDNPLWFDAGLIGFALAFPLINLCSLILIADLTRPARFWRLLLKFKVSSVVSLGSWSLVGFGFFSLLGFLLFLIWVKLIPPVTLLNQLLDIFLTRGSLVIGIFFGLFVASYTGVLLTATSRPLWNRTPLLGGIFLASSLANSLAAILLWPVEFESQATKTLLRAAITLLLLKTCLLFAWASWLKRKLPANYHHLSDLLRGWLAPLFWASVGLEILLPLILIFFAPAKFIAASILLGGLLFRYAIFLSEEE